MDHKNKVGSTPIVALVMAILFSSPAFGITDGQIEAWVSQNDTSSSPAFLLIERVEDAKVLLATQITCSGEPGNKITNLSLLAPQIRYLSQKIISEYRMAKRNLNQHTDLLKDHSVTFALVLGAGASCASAGTSTFSYFDSGINSTIEEKNQSFVTLGFDQLKEYPDSSLSTLTHELGHVLLSKIKPADTLLDETIPDFMEMASNGWDHRIGRSLGKEYQATIRKIIETGGLSEAAQSYQIARLSLSSEDAIRDLSKPRSLLEMPKIDNPYIISIYVNGFFWRLSQIAARNSIEEAFFQVITDRDLNREVFNDNGLRLIKRVLENTLRSEPNLISNPRFRDLIKNENLGGVL